MMNAKGFFFFKFQTKEGMDKLLEEGPWMIRNVPIILKEWSPSVTVEKEDITSIPMWVKMHDVPLAAFTEDGLSLIASKIGTPKMLDSFTATMYVESWGRSSFARALIEIHAESELKKSITMAIPLLDGKGFTKAEVKIDYDWVPLRCNNCCVFGHDVPCPKLPKLDQQEGNGKDGEVFQEAVKKSNKGINKGIQINKQKPKMVYRPVVNPRPKTIMKQQVQTVNSFDALRDQVENSTSAGLEGNRKERTQNQDREDSGRELTQVIG
ncbi:hypothetical protein HanIR_Chr02g0071041 [Helianthus annuus]|nr:hypothetical protein HanIR_Chr02g0071041 [Helianthus annuus]